MLIRSGGIAGQGDERPVKRPIDPEARGEMFDETTAASIVSALRRWTGSSSSKDASSGEAPVAFQSVVQSGLDWSESLRGLTEAGSVELNPLVPNLTETLAGARVVFEPASSDEASRIRPTLDVKRLKTEARGIAPAHDLSTPLAALQPQSTAMQTVLRLSAGTIFDGCTVPVRSWSTETLYGFLHVEWPRRPAASTEEMRWCLLAVAQLVADSCAADENARRKAEAMNHLMDDLRASRDACLLVENDAIVFANEPAVRMFETTERRLRNTRLSDILKAAPERMGGDGESARSARKLTLSDGTIRLVESVERPVGQDQPQLQLVRIYESEAARRARHRALLESLTEAVWQVDLQIPIPVERLAADTLWTELGNASVCECNGRMKELVREMAPAAGESPEVGDVLAFMGEVLLTEFVKSGLRLRNREHRVRGRDGSWRHFVVNLQGVRRDGQLTHILGSTLETTAYVEVEQRTVSALEKQREELGRELHDVVGQLLTGIRLLSSNLARDTTLPSEKVRLHATRVSQMAEEAHLNLRQINRGLSAAHLQHVRLDDALHDLAEFVGAMPTVESLFDCEEAVDELEPETKLQVYRIAQEAVNNALKHSGATQIVIQWRRTDAGIGLAVSDNGHGFDERNLDRKTLGLHSMAYRARVVGAELNIRSAPGKGTTVQCVLPA